MPDVREVFDMVTQKAGPEPGALQRQDKRQRAHQRNQKLAVIGLVAVVVVVGAAVFLSSRFGGNSEPATNPSPTPPVPFDTTPPIGAQIVGLDGAPIQQIAGLPPGASGLRISPDGLTIAFHRGTVVGGAIETIGVAGSALRVIHSQNTNEGDALTEVAWSPDGTRLAYSVSGDIYVSNADGSGRRQLTHSTSDTGSFYPAWSPDGRTIAYWSGQATGQDGGPADAEIYTIPAAGGVPTRLTHDGQNDIEPAWSPDGSQIAYFHAGDLWVMRSDGTHAHKLAIGSDNAWAPAWSPDGGSIAYLSYYANNGDGPLLKVKVLDLSSGDVTDLGMDVVTDLNGPSWMPQGDGLLVNREN